MGAVNCTLVFFLKERDGDGRGELHLVFFLKE